MSILRDSSQPPGMRSVVLNAGAAALLGGAIDGATVAAQAGASPAEETPGFPPGWLIGSVWMVLFGLMGAARAMVQGSGPPQTLARASIVALLLFCAAYPFYTGLFHSVRAELLGNVATILLALAVALLCRPFSRRATALISPTILWLVLATILTLKAGR